MTNKLIYLCCIILIAKYISCKQIIKLYRQIIEDVLRIRFLISFRIQTEISCMTNLSRNVNKLLNERSNLLLSLELGVVFI